MKALRSILIFACLAGWVFPARGVLMTSWEALDEEPARAAGVSDADVSNRVEVLSIHSSADDGTVSVMYRKGKGAAVSAAMFSEDEFASRFSMVGIRGTSGGTFVSASDASTNIAYEGGNSWWGKNGGEGFGGAWGALGERAVPDGMSFESIDLFGDKGFKVVSSSDGDKVVARDFDAPLASGSLDVAAWHDSGYSFTGFALYGEDDTEIFRWGVGNGIAEGGGEREGFVYGVYDNDSLICTLLSEDMGSAYVDYNVAWQQTDRGLALTLTAWDAIGRGRLDGKDDYGEPFAWAPTTITLVGLDTAVKGFAVVVSGNGANMAFDDIEVQGYAPPSPVPEPGTMALLALGGAVLAFRRARRGAGR